MSEASAVRFVVITGMSGAGRRTASHTLEDLGWYVVDNLPPSMMPALLDTALERGFSRVAVIVDVRTRSEFDEIPAAFDTLVQRGVLPQKSSNSERARCHISSSASVSRKPTVRSGSTGSKSRRRLSARRSMSVLPRTRRSRAT